MSCNECEYNRFPVAYDESRRVFAVVATSISLFVAFGALALLWVRRNSRLMLVRDPWLAVLVVFYTVVSLDVPYREYFGEPNMPCSVFYIGSYVKSALIPMVTLVRCVGLYTRHLRQGNAVGAEAPQRTSLSWTLWRKNVDTWLLRNRMDSPWQLRITVAWGVLPWVVYYVIRLAADAENKYHSGKVGCRFDITDAVISTFEGVIVASLLLPILFALRKLADSFLLRCEILATLTAWTPLMGFFLYGKAALSFDIDVFNSAYSILFGNLVSLLACVWWPALASLTDKHMSAPSNFLAALLSEQSEALLDQGVAVVASADLGGKQVLPSSIDSGLQHEKSARVLSAALRVQTATMNAVAMQLDGAGGASPNPAASVFTEGPLVQDAVDDQEEDKAHTPVESFVECSDMVDLPSVLSANTQVRWNSTASTVPVTLGSCVFDQACGTGSTPAYSSGSFVENGSHSRTHLPWDVPKVFHAKHLIDPRPTKDEVVSLLGQAAQSTLSSARSLRLLGWLLVSCKLGRVLLEDILKKEFCAELLGFMLACADVWDAARSIMSADAESKEPAQSNGRSCSPNGSPKAHHDSRSGPEADRRVLLPISSSSQALTNQASPDWTTFVAAYSRLLVQYVVPGAPNQVNLAAAQVRGLNAAAAALVHQRGSAVSGRALPVGPDPPPMQSVLRAALQAICYAESETFRLLVAGPIYRLARNPAQYAAAVAALAAELRVDLLTPELRSVERV